MINELSPLKEQQKVLKKRYIMQTKYDPIDGKKLDISLCNSANIEKYVALQSIIIATDQTDNEITIGSNVTVEVLWKEKSNELNPSKSHVIIQPLSGASVQANLFW